MLNFPEPPKEYRSVFLEETDKPLPRKTDPNLRYAFFSTIATGGKCLIRSCKDMHLSRFVCHKTLKPEFVKDEVEQQRLIREARVSAMLQHPNTVPTYELARDKKGNPYFTMKLVHGYTLREIFDFRERYDLVQLMELIIQIGLCLAYAHKHGVAHRDIKPENILAGPYGEVLLLDWGLAKVWNPDGSTSPDEPQGIKAAGTGETKTKETETKTTTKTTKPVEIEDINLTRHGKPQGTPHYMSPEQINHDPAIDHRTDIYSLGVVLYELLCGKTPAPRGQAHQVIEAVLNQQPEKPSARTDMKVPEVLEQVVMKSMEKDPEKRFATMDEMLRMLQQNWKAELAAGRD